MAFKQIAYQTITLTDNTATALFKFTLPTTLDAVAGRVNFGLYITDGTDIQASSGDFYFSAVNKAGTLTVAVSSGATDDNADKTADNVGCQALSSGTATLVPSIAASGTTATVSFLSNSSLTPTTMTIKFSVDWFSDGTANSRVIPISFLG